MIKKKVCMLGAFAVGKTSLVQRYVYTIFSDKYQTTVGVNIEKKQVAISSDIIDLILWDLQGEDDFQNVQMSYLKGASGCIYVVDGTRSSTLETALGLKRIVEKNHRKIPYVIAFNKIDLKQDWEIEQTTIDDLSGQDGIVIKTSAKTGKHVEKAFQTLTERMIGK